MTQDRRTKFNAQISEEAAEWLVEFRLGTIDASGRREFDAWIRSSPEHLRAYLETAAIWNEGSSLSAHRDLDSDELIALAHAEGNVVSLEFETPRIFPETESGAMQREEGTEAPLSGFSTQVPNGHNAAGPAPINPASQPVLQHQDNRLPSARERSGRDPRSGKTRLVAVAASILIVTAALVSYLLVPRGVYATAVGERRMLTLEDGSSIELNSRSRVQVRFSHDQRSVELMDGQALFHVPKDPRRPFVVNSGAVRIRAVGTQFDVNRRTTGTTVTVVEGRVAVYREEISGSGSAIPPSEIKPQESGRLQAPTARGGATGVTQGAAAPDSGFAMPGGSAAAPTGAAMAGSSVARAVGPAMPRGGTGYAIGPAMSRGGAGGSSGVYPEIADAGASASVNPDSSGPHAVSAAVLLSAGDQVTVGGQAQLPKPQHANPAAATAWTQGQLVLDDTSLADVAEEFSRYSARRLTVEDRGARPLRLSGVFTTAPDFLLRYLRQRPDITVEETPAEVRIIRRD